MAAFDWSVKSYTNSVLQTAEGLIKNIRDHIFEGAGLLGQLVMAGTTSERVAPCGAGETKILGIVVGVYDSDGVYSDSPGTVIATLQRVRVCYLESGVEFQGLLPNTVAVVAGERLKTAASGRLTNLAGTPLVADALASRVQALQALTAGADDTLVLLKVL